MKRLFAISCAMLAIIGCNGPAFPERDGRAYLERRGYPPDIIDAVVKRGQLQHMHIVGFSKCRSVDVRFLVASNPNLSSKDIDLFINDTDDYARSGTAHNTSLTAAQIQKLFNDPSHTVYCGLAGNPSVPTDMLLKLHAERNLGLVFFAMNPKCPPAIKEEIRTSGDDLAKHWLQLIEDRIANQSVESTNGLAGSRR